MMRKKKLVIISVAIVLVVLVGGILGGVVYAQSGSTRDNSPRNTIFAKVASILGIDQAVLEDAFTQAEQEVRSDALNNRLQALVEAGKITQDQADEYLQWWQSQPTLPEGLNLPGLQSGRLGLKGFRMHGCFPPVVDTAPATTQQ